MRSKFTKYSRLLLLLAAFILVACGGGDTEPEDTAPAATEAPAEEEAIEEEATEAPAAEEPATQESGTLSGEIRFMYYADGSEAPAMQSLIDKFMVENPGATVILDVVPYATIDEQIPLLVETGDTPDIARLTNFALFPGNYLDLRPYLQNPDYFESNFNPVILDAFRAEGDDSGLYGFPDSFTVTGPYVNKTLFDQAGIAMPGSEATWEEWTEATQLLAEATGTQYAISVDRTGHRIAGPAMSMGATLFDATDNFTIDTLGFRSFVELLNSWHEDAITPPDVWLIGDAINSCIDSFKSGDLVMCMSGSWQIGGLAADVGDAFDWVVVPNPSGPGGSTGVPGGPSVTAFNSTEHPELVAAFMEFLIQPENYTVFSAEALLLLAQIEVASSPVPFETDNESVLNALNSYTAEVPKLQDQGFTMTYHPFAFAYFRNSANRIGQYLTDELSLDEALQRLQQDIDDAVAEAGS